MNGAFMSLFERVVRYCLAGGLASLLYSLGVIGLVHAAPRLGAIGASVVVFFIMQPVAYFLHRTITYTDVSVAPHQVSESRLRFVIVNVCGFVITVGGMAGVTEILHASYLFGIALIWVLIPATNFLIYLWWVFNVRS